MSFDVGSGLRLGIHMGGCTGVGMGKGVGIGIGIGMGIGMGICMGIGWGMVISLGFVVVLFGLPLAAVCLVCGSGAAFAIQNTPHAHCVPSHNLRHQLSR